MTLLYMFLPVVARLVCVGDEETLGVLLGDEDEGEVGTVGVEDDDVATVIENDDGLASVVLFIRGGSVELLDAV